MKRKLLITQCEHERSDSSCYHVWWNCPAKAKPEGSGMQWGDGKVKAAVTDWQPTSNYLLNAYYVQGALLGTRSVRHAVALQLFKSNWGVRPSREKRKPKAAYSRSWARWASWSLFPGLHMTGDWALIYAVSRSDLQRSVRLEIFPNKYEMCSLLLNTYTF